MFYWFYGCHCILLTNYTEIIEDIKILNATNEEIIEKIKLMEEESLYESDEDSDSIVETEFTNSVVSNPKIEVKKNKNPDEKHKCGQCDLVCKTNVESIQLKVLKRLMIKISACNICDEGFDKETKVREHIVEVHNDIVTQIKEILVEEDNTKVDESYGESLLSMFGNDGNAICFICKIIK